MSMKCWHSEDVRTFLKMQPTSFPSICKISLVMMLELSTFEAGNQFSGTSTSMGLDWPLYRVIMIALVQMPARTRIAIAIIWLNLGILNSVR